MPYKVVVRSKGYKMLRKEPKIIVVIVVVVMIIIQCPFSGAISWSCLSYGVLMVVLVFLSKYLPLKIIYSKGTAVLFLFCFTCRYILNVHEIELERDSLFTVFLKHCPTSVHFNRVIQSHSVGWGEL